MRWQYIKSPSDIKERCLRLDGVNDYVNIPGNSFYNVGSEPFSFVLRILWLGAGAGNSTDITTSLCRKNPSGGVVQRFVLNLSSTPTGSLRFSLVDSAGTVHTLMIPNTYFTAGVFTTAVITREGTNSVDSTDTMNWPSSVRNPENYKIYINGTLINWSSVPEILPANVDNPGTFTLGEFGSTYFTGYIDKFAAYNRALLPAEVAGIEVGFIPNDGAKGFWGFDGSMADSSSVANNATLVNNALSTLYIYPRTNAIVAWGYNVIAQIKTWTVIETAIITSIIRFGGTTTVEYSTDGITYTSLSFTSDLATVSLAVTAGQTLYFKTTTSGNHMGAVQINY